MDAAAAIHPNDQILQAYGLGKLDDASSEAVSKHLESCSDCQRRVAEMSSDSFFGRLRGAQASPEMSATNRSQFGSPHTDAGPAVAVSPPPADTLPPELVEHRPANPPAERSGTLIEPSANASARQPKR
jgi:hypothetical protein